MFLESRPGELRPCLVLPLLLKGTLEEATFFLSCQNTEWLWQPGAGKSAVDRELREGGRRNPENRRGIATAGWVFPVAPPL